MKKNLEEKLNSLNKWKFLKNQVRKFKVQIYKN